MSDLLIYGGAVFSADRTKRLSLTRIWDEEKPNLIMVLMNPSTADEDENDATVERCQRRAHQLEYGGLQVFNILDHIETDSRKLDQIPREQLCTGENLQQLLRAVENAAGGEGDIVCGWGKPGQKYGPVAWFTTRAARAGVPLWCLGTNADGSPKHPLYVPYSQPLVWFAGARDE